MKKSQKEATVECFLYELKQLSEKYGIWIEVSEDAYLTDGGKRILANYFEFRNRSTGYVSVDNK
ncbi:hypothetical protein AAHH67_15640 [Niallia circulans]